MKQYLKPLALLLVGLILASLLVNYPAPHERILNIQNYLITVGGIISAFVIAYLSAKIFNIKADRDARQLEIDKLGERLTAFRQMLYFVMHSRDFWVRYNDIALFKKSYPGYDYEKIRAETSDERMQHFYLKQREISQNTIGLYLAMEAIYDHQEKYITPWAMEQAVTERYDIDDLAKYHDACNQIWYYLDGRYGKHGAGLFNDEGLSIIYAGYFQDKLAIADVRKKGQDFHRLILSGLGSEFHEFVIPKMAELIRQNMGIPAGLLKTFYSLLATMFFGVIMPLVLQALEVSDHLDTFLTLSFVHLTTLSLLYFLFEFYALLEDEVHTNKKWQ